MVTPTKFRAASRQQALAVLRAGGSRRDAARAAGVDHATLLRWVKRGKNTYPEGFYGEFYEAVTAAEAGDHTPQLLVDDTDPEMDPWEAFRYLERHAWHSDTSTRAGIGVQPDETKDGEP